MKNLITIIIIGFLQVGLFAQPCSTADITLLSQNQVDSFQINFGPCDTVLGTLEIGDFTNTTTNITDLTPLAGLKDVFSLIIVDNDSLLSLNGLHNLQVDGVSKLSVSRNLKLNDISQLSGFGPSGGDISIAENDSLASLEGLQGLRTLGTALQVRDLPKITNLDPLIGITRIDRALTIQNNDALTDISGLSNLSAFGSALNPIFTLSGNGQLEDCRPLCYVIQRLLPPLNSLMKDIQGNSGGCVNEAAILDVCLLANNGIYSGCGTVPVDTEVAIENTIQFDTTTFIIDGTSNRVGIGTDVPMATLDVDGTIQITGIPTSGTLSKIIAIDASGNAFELDISNYDSDASDDFDKQFSSLIGVPAGLADGDDDTQLTDAQITALGYIKSANDADADPMNEIQDLSPYQTIAGAANWDQDASDDFDGAFSNLTGLPAGLVDGDDDTQLTDAQITALGYIKNSADADADPMNEIPDLSPYQTIAGAANWDQDASDDFDGAFTSLSGVPAGLSDGDDNSSLYDTDGVLTENRNITQANFDVNFDAYTLVINGSDNKVGIGTNTPTYELDIIGDLGVSGGIYGLSDKRLKKNERPITNALDIISQLNPVTYEFRNQEFSNFDLPEQQQYGLLAQELQEILPELVSSKIGPDGEEYLTINYDGLIAVLIQAVRELKIASDK